uniref:Formyl transferase N-terminal domain-containing protein n=1 Tax=Polytomella parva TaxID=51329 RepID=A0A7S0VKT6_9CHLO|mmetsp:Transcript_7777/g.15183  ORF Transcript_7777/g.15183 Transcript_7777/m.15183 type:complete len:289 (+) Transcript_7777:26-892(+)
MNRFFLSVKESTLASNYFQQFMRLFNDLNCKLLHQDYFSQEEASFWRIEYECGDNDSKKICDALQAQQQYYKDKQVDFFFNLRNSVDIPRVAILATKQEHCLLELLNAARYGELNCDNVLVISNHPDLAGIAKTYDVPFYHFPILATNNASKIHQESMIESVLSENNIHLIVLAKYMQILSPDFIERHKHQIINIHHSLLPAFIGSKPYERAYDRGVKIIGATAHYCTSELDQGPIIHQDVLRVSHRDTVEDMIRKGKDLEKNVLKHAIKLHIENRVLVHKNRTITLD